MGSPPPDRDPRPKLALTSAPDSSAQIQQVFYCFIGECFLKTPTPTTQITKEKGKINLTSFQKIGYHKSHPRPTSSRYRWALHVRHIPSAARGCCKQAGRDRRSAPLLGFSSTLALKSRDLFLSMPINSACRTS
jgi:hypothetical protein